MEAAKQTDAIAPPLVPCDEAKEIAHVGFEIGLLFKALHGLVQLLGGLVMLYVTPQRLSALTDFLTRHRLSCNPQAIFAGASRQAQQQLFGRHPALCAFLSFFTRTCPDGPRLSPLAQKALRLSPVHRLFDFFHRLSALPLFSDGLPHAAALHAFGRHNGRPHLL